MGVGGKFASNTIPDDAGPGTNCREGTTGTATVGGAVGLNTNTGLVFFRFSKAFLRGDSALAGSAGLVGLASLVDCAVLVLR